MSSMVKLLEGVNADISRLGITFLVITKMCLQTEATKKVFAVGSGLIFISPSLDRYETRPLLRTDLSESPRGM